ncbi:hypothetical protein FWK35_00034202, partial [Aphis craccivora]
DVYTGIHDTSTIPLNDQFEVTYDEEDDEFPPIERSRPVLKKKTRQVVQYENFEESGVFIPIYNVHCSRIKRMIYDSFGSKEVDLKCQQPTNN